MNNWNPSKIERAPKKAKKTENLVDSGQPLDGSFSQAGAYRLELPLKAGGRAVIVVPMTITAEELKRLKAMFEVGIILE